MGLAAQGVGGLPHHVGVLAQVLIDDLLLALAGGPLVLVHLGGPQFVVNLDGHGDDVRHIHAVLGYDSRVPPHHYRHVAVLPLQACGADVGAVLHLSRTEVTAGKASVLRHLAHNPLNVLSSDGNGFNWHKSSYLKLLSDHPPWTGYSPVAASLFTSASSASFSAAVLWSSSRDRTTIP